MKINNRRKYCSKLITRILLIIIFLLFILIINKYNRNLILKFKNELFNKSFNFVKVNQISQRLLGKDVFYYQDNNDLSKVFANELETSGFEKYYDGEKIYVSDNLPIGNLSSGIVVFIGNKENYGNTIIIQGMDGYNIWYGNLKDINVKLYDYVEAHDLIGSADGDFLYLLIEKDNRYYSYDEYK